MRVDVGEVERNHARGKCGIPGPVERQAARLKRREAFERVAEQGAFVRAHPVHAELREIVHRRCKRDGVGDVARTGFEFPGELVEGRVLVLNLADHVAAGKERRHRFEQLALAVEQADAGRAEHLVAAEREEIDVERLHVDRHMRNALRAVDQDVVPAARAAGTMRSSGAIVPSVLLTCEIASNFAPSSNRSRSSSCKSAAIVGRNKAQLGAGLLGQQLPRHEVGVMFELCGKDRVAGFDVLQAPAIPDQVDRFGRVARPDDFAMIGVDEARDCTRARLRTPRWPARRSRRRRGGCSRCTRCSKSTSASITACGFCEVAAESR